MRRAAKVDTNHSLIREAFRRMGFSVADTAKLGDGFGDLVIARDQVTALVEVKRDRKAKLTDDQIKFHGSWKGLIFVVTGIDDAANVNTMMRQEANRRAEAIQRRRIAD